MCTYTRYQERRQLKRQLKAGQLVRHLSGRRVLDVPPLLVVPAAHVRSINASLHLARPRDLLEELQCLLKEDVL